MWTAAHSVSSTKCGTYVIYLKFLVKRPLQMTEATYIIVDKLEDLEGYTGKKDHTKFYCHEENHS